jgi:hypothetical protein
MKKKKKQSNEKEEIYYYQQQLLPPLPTTFKHKKTNIISMYIDSFDGVLLETGIFISKTPFTSKETITKVKGDYLEEGDRILFINGLSLANKSLVDFMEIIKQLESNSNLNLIVQRSNLTIQKNHQTENDQQFQTLTQNFYNNCRKEPMLLSSPQPQTPMSKNSISLDNNDNRSNQDDDDDENENDIDDD